MKRIENPFRPGNGTMPPYLAGRKDELLWFESSLNSALSFPQNLVLSGLPPLFPNLVKAKTYAERMFSVKSIGNLPREASWEAIRLPLKNSNITFTDELIKAIVEETQGYLYFLQFYPYYLIQNIPKKRIGFKEFNEMSPLLLRETGTPVIQGKSTQTD